MKGHSKPLFLVGQNVKHNGNKAQVTMFWPDLDGTYSYRLVGGLLGPVEVSEKDLLRENKKK